jgi:hypothetical protein
LKADRVIAVSNFIKSYLLKNYPGELSGKLTVIQRGADLNYFNAKAVSNSLVVELMKKWHLPEDKKIIYHYVPESMITDEIKRDLLNLGWKALPSHDCVEWP